MASLASPSCPHSSVRDPSFSAAEKRTHTDTGTLLELKGGLLKKKYCIVYIVRGGDN